jgi:hypothetical protein
MIVVLGTFLHVLGLDFVTIPLQRMVEKVLAFFPNLFAGVLFFLLAWGSATLLRLIFLKAVHTLKLDERISQRIESEDKIPITKTIGDVVYWLVFLLFLPLILESLGFESMFKTVNSIWIKVMDYLPQIFLAAVTLLVGWFLARVVERITTNLLAAMGVDRISDKAGIGGMFGGRKLSVIIGTIVYVLTLLPVMIAALEALKAEAITKPFTDMLTDILSAVPYIFLAGTILIIAYIVGRIVSDLVRNFLVGIGFDTFFVRIGLVKDVAQGDRSPSQVAARIVNVAIMLFAAIIACEKLGFFTIVQLGHKFLEFSGHVLLGLAIFVVGVYLADLAGMAVKAGKGRQTHLLSVVTKAVILLFSGAIALQQIIPESEIIVIGFTFIGGTICLALSIAFGVGGIKIASTKLEKWVNSLDSDNSKPN